jgi:hypothetical protein
MRLISEDARNFIIKLTVIISTLFGLILLPYRPNVITAEIQRHIFFQKLLFLQEMIRNV